MDEEIERLVVSVRADTAGFARDVAAMRGDMEGPLANGAMRAGRAIEQGLSRAMANGRLGFDELKRVALNALAEMAAAALRVAIGGGEGGGSASGLAAVLAGSGAPGRAHGGPVQRGQAYRVGERGPELFVPSSGGRIEPMTGAGRDVRVSIAVQSGALGGGDEPMMLRQSARQVARAVARAVGAR